VTRRDHEWSQALGLVRPQREGRGGQPHCGRLSFPSTTIALALAREFDLYQLYIAICFVSPGDRILLILLLMSLIYFSVYPSSLCAAIFPLSPLYSLLSSIVGFQDKLKVVDGTLRVCPKCHNGNPTPTPLTSGLGFGHLDDSTVYSYLSPSVAVVRATTRMWFSFFLIRVIPFRKSHIWICSTCNWNVPTQNGYVLARAFVSPFLIGTCPQMGTGSASRECSVGSLPAGISACIPESVRSRVPALLRQPAPWLLKSSGLPSSMSRPLILSS